jgi:hypothetical protein
LPRGLARQSGAGFCAVSRGGKLNFLAAAAASFLYGFKVLFSYGVFKNSFIIQELFFPVD